MKLSVKKVAVVGGLAGAVLAVLPLTSASAINQVQGRDCRSRTDLVRIWNGQATCFANRGEMDVSINNVESLITGNNKVTFWVAPMRAQDQVRPYVVEKHRKWNFPHWVRITKVKIH